ncbi:MAG: Uma2 family endonuclease [Dehalococcoidia bacterium]|nr:Uma2 family endonuclease [Dehalococcoidia bacterium]MDW8120185.1 Uma2 family endonuclease [Chloroflexota bacterium]
MTTVGARRLFTVEEYHRMAETGILGEDDRVELLEGEIRTMAPIGIRHASTVLRLIRILSEKVGPHAFVNAQNPVRLGPYSEPQPDITLLVPRPDYYASAHPGPQDVLLLIEVADTSADYERQVKVPLYARAGVREVWLVDLAAGCVEVYREPAGQGYGRVERVGRGERLTPLALPGLEVPVEAILG